MGEAEELSLIRAWQVDGSRRALDEIVSSHMRICFSVAARYTGNESHIKDLAQEGAMGLMTAADKFDPGMGKRFASYARWWVKAAVSKRAAMTTVVVDIPPRVYMKARSPEDKDDDVGWEARQAARGAFSLDAQVGDEGETTVGSLLKCPKPDPEAVAMDFDREAIFRKAISDGLANAMTPRESEVLRRRTLETPPHTLEQIADDFDLSRERIRQIEVTAAEKLKRWLASNAFPKSLLRC